MPESNQSLHPNTAETPSFLAGLHRARFDTVTEASDRTMEVLDRTLGWSSLVGFSKANLAPKSEIGQAQPSQQIDNEETHTPEPTLTDNLNIASVREQVEKSFDTEG